jgi:nucleotide-binding universal stress UspA family protein
MAAMALITDWLGVKDVLGAFVAGILIGQSPILTRHIEEQLRGIITALFMPVFFGIAGLSANLTVLKNPQFALLTVGLILIASVGKFVGAFIGGKVGGLSRAESLALGCGMNARGSTEVIVATIGLSMGVLSQSLFTLIVTMAVLTTLAMPPMLRWALRRLPMGKKERLRLEREELDAKGFVTNLERLLLAADDSVNGKIAARIVGAIAGSGGKPTTILELRDEERDKKAARAKTEKAKAKAETAKSDDEASEHAVKSAAEDTTTLDAHPDEEMPGKVEVITRQPDALNAETVAGEARKGYDLLVVGIGRTRNPKGGFSKDVSQITKGFAGPVAVIDSPRSQNAEAGNGYSRILIPVNGSEVSRRAVEVGLTLARSDDAEVTALYVTPGHPNGGRRKTTSRRRATRRNELAVLKDIGALADRYEVDMRSMTQAHMAPDEAILNESKRGYDLIVLGVSRRPGDSLFFGNTAAALLDRSETAKLFVAS